MTKKLTAKKLDKEIEQIFLRVAHQGRRRHHRTSSGVQIDIMDIGKIFAAGRAAYAAGTDLEAAIVATVTALRKN